MKIAGLQWASAFLRAKHEREQMSNGQEKKPGKHWQQQQDRSHNLADDTVALVRFLARQAAEQDYRTYQKKLKSKSSEGSKL